MFSFIIFALLELDFIEYLMISDPIDFSRQENVNMNNKDLFLCFSCLLIFVNVFIFVFERNQNDNNRKLQKLAKKYWKNRAQNMNKRKQIYIKSVGNIQEPIPKSLKESRKLDVSTKYQTNLKKVSVQLNISIFLR